MPKSSLNKYLTIAFCSSLLLLVQVSSFWVQISPATSPKCYQATLFAHEDLLVELQLPIIDDMVQFAFTVRNDADDVIFTKIIQKSTDRITVSMDNTPKPGSIRSVQACIGSTVASTDPTQKDILTKKSHLIWFVQLNHFSHQIQGESKAQIVDPFQIKFIRMKERILKLQGIYLEQQQFFDIEQNAETKNQKDLEAALQEAYTMILVESAVIVVMTIVYISILKQYFWQV